MVRGEDVASRAGGRHGRMCPPRQYLILAQPALSYRWTQIVGFFSELLVQLSEQLKDGGFLSSKCTLDFRRPTCRYGL